MKAYVVFPGDNPMDAGCLLVLAETRNKARKFGCGLFDYGEYIDMNALRRPGLDFLAKSNEPHSYETNDELPQCLEPFYADYEV